MSYKKYLAEKARKHRGEYEEQDVKIQDALLIAGGVGTILWIVPVFVIAFLSNFYDIEAFRDTTTDYLTVMIPISSLLAILGLITGIDKRFRNRKEFAQIYKDEAKLIEWDDNSADETE
jgi:hypothetical protein